jgi:hypothetical protein
VSGNIHQLSQHLDIIQHIAPASYAAEQNGAGIDMQGWDGVLFLLDIGATAATAVLNAEVEVADDSGMATNLQEVIGSQITAITDAIDNKIVAIDLSGNFPRRWVRLEVIPSVAATIFGVIAIRYRGRSLPAQVAALQQTLLIADPRAQAVT